MNFDSIPWRLIKGRKEQEVVLVRHRLFSADFPKGDFAHRLNIFWQMSDASANGMPEDSETKLMEVFEDRLVEATEPDEEAVLSMVVTGNSQREYVFHTRSTDEFLRRLTEMPQEEERYPIELHHTEDAEWEYFDRVLGDFAIQ